MGSQRVRPDWVTFTHSREVCLILDKVWIEWLNSQTCFNFSRDGKSCLIPTISGWCPRWTADSEGRAAACSAGFMKALLALHARWSCLPEGSSFREIAENENLSHQSEEMSRLHSWASPLPCTWPCVGEIFPLGEAGAVLWGCKIPLLLGGPTQGHEGSVVTWLLSCLCPLCKEAGMASNPVLCHLHRR